jgi:hypothetical protein
MNTKAAVAILLAAIFALSSIATITIMPVKAVTALTLSDTELYNEFGWMYDPGSSLTGKTDVPGPGVRFDLAGLGKAGIGDNHPVSQSAGGGAYYGHYSDFTGYGLYSMLFVNLGSGAIQVSLFMNTGFTSSGAWGTRDWHYDTFWCSNWVTIDPQQSKIVTLNFSSSYEAWNIADDPVYTGHTNGEHGTPIFRLNEVTAIGFQVLGSGSASVLASGTLTKLYIDPPIVNKMPSDVCHTDFTVDVALENFVNLYGFDIKLTWDSTLITFVSADKTPLNALWPSGWTTVSETSDPGFYRLVVTSTSTAASNAGASVLFRVTLHVARSCNFPLSTSIHFAVVKLSDNGTPTPNPIYAEVTDGMYNISNTKPDLEFVVHDPDPSKPFEFCKTFEVEVWVTHICANLKDFDFIILYDSSHLRFVDVDYWGVLGGLSDNAHVELLAPGRIHVWDAGGLTFNSGDGLLFGLTFHVEFNDDITHIWRKNSPHTITAEVSFENAQLSFLEGPIDMGGITMPPTLVITISLIRGDVTCDGKVNLADISAIAYHYNEVVPPGPEKYDLTQDGVIDIYDIVTAATNYGYGMP